jgi:hypothetical protein
MICRSRIDLVHHRDVMGANIEGSIWTMHEKFMNNQPMQYKKLNDSTNS